MSDILMNIPEESRNAFERYLALPGESRSEILEDLEAYLETISLVATESDLFDVELARELGDGLKKLLERCDDENLTFVQATIRYFMEDDDASPDLRTSLGFEDDAQVFNCVCVYLGHHDLKLSL